MKKALIMIAILLTLTGCDVFRVHKMSVEQGNIITPEMLHQIHPGMSQAAVHEIMGTPMLTNTFTEGRDDYVYTYKPGYGPMSEKRITLIFRRGVLSEISGTLTPQAVN